MSWLTLLKGTSGLNNAVDPVQLRPNEGGISPLAAAFNVDVEQGRLSRRRGYTRKRTEASHSFFGIGTEGFFVSAGDLYRLHPDYSRSVLRAGVGDAPMAYVHAANTTFYSNGVVTGQIPVGGASHAWTCPEYVGPTTDRTFDDPPAGHLLAFHDSRILIAQESVVWHSEKLAYGRFDLASNFVRERTRISLLAPVTGGVFIGTAQGVAFYDGKDFKLAVRTVTPCTGAIEGTLFYAQPETLNPLLDTNFTDPLAIWTAPDGIYVGGPEGFCRNLTKGRLVYPAATRGTALVYDNRYLTLLHE